MDKTKVLIVDDREENLIALERILNELDVEIIMVTSGNDALAYLVENEVGLILIDVQMPDMDGFETVQLMKQDSKLQDIPVIFVSAIYTDEFHSIKGIESGAVDFIVKPIIPEIILGKVKIFVKMYENKKCLEILNQELVERENITRTIAYVTNSLVYPTLDLLNISNIIIKSLNDLTNSEFSYLYVIDNDKMTLTRYNGTDEKIMDYKEELDEQLDIWNYSMITRNHECENSLEDSSFIDNVDGIHSVLSQPVISREEVTGQIILCNSTTGYTGQHIEVVEKLSALYGIAISRIRDEYNRERLENDVRESEKFRVIGQLVGGISHDFNNILAGILSSAQLLAQPSAGLEKKNLKYVNIITDASTRATELISKLLQFENKAVISKSPVSVNNILDDALLLLNRTLSKKIEIKQFRNAKYDVIDGNLAEIENVVLNLCINSAHSMDDHGTIEIHTEDRYLNEEYCKNSSFKLTPGKYCAIEVRDSGKGIDENDLNKIFEPFFSTKGVGKGTGLGLAVTYGTIQAHNGEIKVKSIVNEGTVFTILLPYSSNNVVEKKEDSILKNYTGTVLFADDEEINRILGEDILESLGFEVLLAEDGKRALEIYRDNLEKVDLVILDMLMPVMNGSEAFYELKKINDDIKVIIASGFMKDENSDKLKADGVSGFLEKPYLIEDLSAMINSVR